MEPQEYGELLRTLVRIAAHQETISEDLRAMLGHQDAHLARLDRAIERIDVILACLETLITRMTQQSEGGS